MRNEMNWTRGARHWLCRASVSAILGMALAFAMPALAQDQGAADWSEGASDLMPFWQAIDRGDFDVAEAGFQSAVDGELHVEAMTGLATVSAMRGFWSRALEQAESVLPDGEGPPMAHLVRCAANTVLGNLSSADPSCNAAAIEMPDYPVVWNLLCALRTAQYDWSGAITVCETGLGLEPDSVEMGWRLGLSLTQSGRIDEGREQCEEVAAQEGGLTMGSYCLGVAHLLAGRPTEAQAACDAGLTDGSDHALLRYCRGMASMQLADLDAARTDCAQAVELAPDEALGHLCLGQVASVAGELEAAQTHLTRAQELNPALPEARGSLADVLTRGGRFADGEAMLREVMEHSPSVDHRFMLARNLYQQSRLDEAIAELTVVVEQRPDFAAAHGMLAMSLRAQGRGAEAMAAMERAAAVDPENIEWPLFIISERLRNGDPAGGLALAEEAAGRFPPHPTLQVMLCQAMQFNGRGEETDLACQRAVELDPENGAPDLVLATRAVNRGDWANALPLLERGLSLRPEESTAWHNLGMAHSGLQDWQGAADAFSRALELRPEQVASMVGLGQALQMLGRDDEARALFCEVVARQPDWPGVAARCTP
jgi:tetratricopeptide (TPR) repeat protein